MKLVRKGSIMILGSHVNYGKEGLLGCVKQSISYKATAFMFYTGAPQNSVRKPIDENLTKEAQKLMQENNIDINNIICHAPYIINLANKSKLEAWEFSISFLKEEIKRCETLGVKYIVLHPGSSVSHPKEEALQNVIDALNEVIDEDTHVMILLETMAGKGTELGTNIEEIKTILDNIIYRTKIGVCLDTCHLNDSGIDISKFDAYLDEFDKTIGLSKVKCLHLNDSLNPLGSHKDRHANIGHGTIGFDTLIDVCYNPKLKDVPKILETPYIEDNAPYYYEINSILTKTFYPNLKEMVIEKLDI